MFQEKFFEKIQKDYKNVTSSVHILSRHFSEIGPYYGTIYCVEMR